MQNSGEGANTTNLGQLCRQKLLLIVALGAAVTVPIKHVYGQASTTTVITCGPNNQILPGVCGTTSTAFGANTGNIVSRDVSGQVDSEIEDIRTQKEKQYGAALYTKAPPQESGVQVAAWGTGSYEHDRQTGTFNGADIASTIHNWGGIGGVDFTGKIPSDAYVVWGFFAGEKDAFISVPTGATATTRAAVAGAYLFYLKDNFTADLTYTAAWMRNSGTNVTSSITESVNGGTLTAVSTSSAVGSVVMMDSFEGNLRYKFNLDNNWWIEPFGGAVWTYQVETMGFENIGTLKLQGGARVGTSFTWGSTRVEPTLTAFAFSDVSITGGFVPGGPPIENDRGQLWGKGVGRINFIWSKEFESFIEASIFGTGGLENVVAYSGTLGIRLKF
jgi:Autotransporter beta-domain